MCVVKFGPGLSVGFLACCFLPLLCWSFSDNAQADDLDCLSGFEVSPAVELTGFSAPVTFLNADGSFRLDGVVAERLSDAGLETRKREIIDDWFHQGVGRFILHHKKRQRRDRYGRLPVFVTIERESRAPDIGYSLQARLLREGLVRVDLDGLTGICADRLLAYERQARLKHIGIWSLRDYQAYDALDDHLSALVSSYRHVTGTVLSVFRSEKGTSYLNFGHHWKTDFTIALGKKARMQWEGDDKSLEHLRGTSIYVRGWIETQNGPLIRITHPQQLSSDVGDTIE